MSIENIRESYVERKKKEFKEWQQQCEKDFEIELDIYKNELNKKINSEIKKLFDKYFK
jgi:hypothetical protein